MLNISPVKLSSKMNLRQFPCYSDIRKSRGSQRLAYWLIGFLVTFIVILMLPWTQNVRAKGQITTLRPEHRPQTINSNIDGRIESWYVQEGQFVEKGDTILYLSEINSEYLDTNLLELSRWQVEAKELSMDAYRNKADALIGQMQALRKAQELKIEQAHNKLLQAHLKVEADSIDWEAAKVDLSIADKQLQRTQELYEKQIKSLVEVETKRQKQQKAYAKSISTQNKLLASRNELLNAQINLNSIRAEYADKLAKVESERLSAMSFLFDAQGSRAKLKNQFSSYKKRSEFYYILAPQNGFINQVIKPGIGEVVKKGGEILSIMPADYELAVEVYVNPMDYPLIRPGQEVRLIFDGWPAVVFSGWPDRSMGTFGGIVVAMDRITSKNNRYRILISPAPGQDPWPDALQVGTGAEGMALLNDVPLWYEFWRQLNGFPPDFYNTFGPDAKKAESVKMPKVKISK